MPELQRKVSETEKQLQEIQTHEITLGKQLELMDFTTFIKQMNHNLEDLDILDKRKILKLLVKEIQVDSNTIHIQHSIPLREVKQKNQKKVMNCVRGVITPPCWRTYT